jgi:acyl-CoA synthetase (AMP-forming)/AMP-acid ligase II
MGTIGLPFPDTDMKIVDLELGTRELATGEVGELCISGPQVMKGYWNKPEETAAALRRGPDGRIWLHTGDIASVDCDGFTSIVQRKKEMIEHCRTSLAEYKVPRQVEVRDTLPMSAVGKILYRVLREEHAALSRQS